MPDRSRLMVTLISAMIKKTMAVLRESLENNGLRILYDDKAKCKSIQSRINQK